MTKLITNKDNCSKGGKTPRRVYRYSLLDIAKATGKSIHTVRRDKRNGKLKMDDFMEVVKYVVDRKVTIGI